MYNEGVQRRNEMSELEVRIAECAVELHYVLDDDQSDVLDTLVMDIADEFGIEDTEWIRNKIEENY